MVRERSGGGVEAPSTEQAMLVHVFGVDHPSDLFKLVSAVDLSAIFWTSEITSGRFSGAHLELEKYLCGRPSILSIENSGTDMMVNGLACVNDEAGMSSWELLIRHGQLLHTLQYVDTSEWSSYADDPEDLAHLLDVRIDAAKRDLKICSANLFLGIEKKRIDLILKSIHGLLNISKAIHGISSTDFLLKIENDIKINLIDFDNTDELRKCVRSIDQLIACCQLFRIGLQLEIMGN